MYYFIYLLFGKRNETLQSELVYSLLSFDKIADDRSKKTIRFLIYTETGFVLPESLNGLQVSFSRLDPDEIEEALRKTDGHSLVLKAIVVADFLARFKACGILVDTDTFFIRDPCPLFEKIRDGYSLMHLKEYPISRMPELVSFFTANSFKRPDGDSFNIIPAFHMWNSGVVGVKQGDDSLLEKIICLIQQISTRKAWPREYRRFIEQTAYSYYLGQRQDKLLSAENYIVHYWFFKEGRLLLGNYFRYFHGFDDLEFREILKLKNVRSEDLAGIPYQALPALMVGLMKKFSLVREYHYDSLPENTHIGKILRNLS